MCEYIQPIWIQIEELMYEYNMEHIKFDTHTVMFNTLIDNPRNVKNFICLLFKSYVYTQRCLGEKPSFVGFKKLLSNHRTYERYIATKNGKLSKHIKKWGGTQSINSISYYENNYVTEYINELESFNNFK